MTGTVAGRKCLAMVARMSAKERVRHALRSVGVEVGGYRYTVPARRQQMLDHYDIETLIDVGANVGQYGLATRAAGYRRNLISFEPAHQAFTHLAATVRADQRWRAECMALGAEEGTLTLNISEGSIFSSALTVTDEAVSSSPNARVVGTEEVPLRTLDAYLSSNPAEGPLAVKIDVQGFEGPVLDGASETLARARMVEMELTPVAVYDNQMLMEDAVARMTSAGFVLSLTENLFPQPDTGRALQFNGIFVRP